MKFVVKVTYITLAVFLGSYFQFFIIENANKGARNFKGLGFKFLTELNMNKTWQSSHFCFTTLTFLLKKTALAWGQ